MRDMETDPLWEDTLMGGAFWKEQDKKDRFYNELWEDTLMGAEFWREEDRNNPYDTTYHVQYSGIFFPVALQKHILEGGSMDRDTLRGIISSDNSMGARQAVLAHTNNKENTELNEALYKERRSSMSDLGSLKSGPFSAASKRHFWDFSKKAYEEPVTSNKGHTRTGRSLIRSAFGSSAIRSKSVQHEDSRFDFGFDPHPGSEENPLLYFRGGASWKYIERNLDVLCLDLFWPIKQKASTENDMIKVAELRPLCTFRHLRVLKLTGMMQSYQTMIWQVVWLNPDLEELDLEMALEPCIRRGFNGYWTSISPGWKIAEKDEHKPVYYGNGDGNIHNDIGTGEYLDKRIIESSRLLARMMGPTNSRLSVVVIRLAGFVVDGDPFDLWFEPHRLRRIQFKHNCVDAGFYLGEFMKDTVEVIFPKKAVPNTAQIGRVVDLAKELKVIELRKGRKISEAPYYPPGGFQKACCHHRHDDQMPAEPSSHRKGKENEHSCCKKTDAGAHGGKGINADHRGVATGGEESDNSTDRKKGTELSRGNLALKSPRQASMATAAPRPKGAPRHGRNAIVPRMVGKLAQKGKSTVEKE
ncbi:hypothetical protein C8Q69DRAFT_531679 [Paecilomyces variotii]|uniref:Uncharacterized protein n=1 Tax=Byssochlamys spectabilis TaxID=264951 RepID=A0A443HHF4_BYSSP|nr:hypothetical protein C8Q69DRAFT_531679 [Paecilomyces variotii]KAJ9349936.1 hypothetical protein DTO280E4_8851 [Paecilomyces variotii]RWQ91199.1 hypothetical protein C8Q69DRAFT_531679 [Paecilomyces variotii]